MTNKGKLNACINAMDEARLRKIARLMRAVEGMTTEEKKRLCDMLEKLGKERCEE